MRLTESRLRQIIREELAADVAADVAADEFAADVDAAYALADTQQERMRVLQPAFAGLHNLPARMGRHGGKASNWLRQNDGLQQLMAVAPGVRRQVEDILALTDEYGDRLADRDGVLHPAVRSKVGLLASYMNKLGRAVYDRDVAENPYVPGDLG